MRPRVVVSACLLGEPVRYDGAHKESARLIALLAGCEILPVCPEVEIGLGVPRPPIEIALIGGEPRLRRIADGFDLTVRMQEFAEARIRAWLREGVDGFVLKDRSPSCGVASVPLQAEDGTIRRDGTGAFAAMVRKLAPDVPLIEEEALFRAGAGGFLESVFRHAGA